MKDGDLGSVFAASVMDRGNACPASRKNALTDDVDDDMEAVRKMDLVDRVEALSDL